MFGQALVTINEDQWAVLVATTYGELTTGLSGRSSMNAGTGMLFVLSTNQVTTVDTTRMLFPLDIIFILDNTVIDVARGILPGNFVTEETPCDSFLEVNAGEAASVEVGDAVSVATVLGGGFDLNQVVSFAVPLAVLGFVCAIGGGMLMSGRSSHSSEVRRLGGPRTEEERAKVHEEFYPRTSIQRPTRDDVSVNSWVERDRLGIWITDNRTDKVIAEWWDDDAREMFEDGFFKPATFTSSGELGGAPFIDSVLDYAESVGLLAKETEHSQGSERRLGEPKGEAERRATHQEKYGTKELPLRGTGLEKGKSRYYTSTKEGESELSMADKVRQLGFSPDKFWALCKKVDEAMIGTEGVIWLSADKRRRGLEEKVYPLLREFKQKYGFDCPISSTGVDIFHLETRIDNALRQKREAASQTKSSAVIPIKGKEKGSPSELKYFADSPEFLTQTVDATGYRSNLDDAFLEAIARAKGLK